MQEDRDLGGLKRREVQPATEDTTMKLLWQVSEKVRNHTVFIQSKQIRAGAFNTTDDQGHNIEMLILQIPVELSRNDSSGEADVACINIYDKRENRTTRYFFRSSAEGVRLESFLPDPYSSSDVSDLEPSDVEGMMERVRERQEKTRALERSVGFSIALESEAQELLRLVKRAVIVQW